MIVIADASPLNYLILIGDVEVLRQLYGRVVVPSGVARELTAGGSPSVVRAWASAVPHWIEVRQVDVPAEAGLDTVDEGEAEAIVLAEGLRPDVLLIIDDRDGRREAARRGIKTTGRVRSPSRLLSVATVQAHARTITGVRARSPGPWPQPPGSRPRGSRCGPRRSPHPLPRVSDGCRSTPRRKRAMTKR